MVIGHLVLVSEATTNKAASCISFKVMNDIESGLMKKCLNYLNVKTQAPSKKTKVKDFNCTCDTDTAKRRDDAGLHISSLVPARIGFGISPGQLSDIKVSLEREWKWHDVIGRQCPHAPMCQPLIQHHCATLTLARRVNLGISCSKCGSLWKATVERCETAPLLR